jgi:hypothetical protein
MMKQLVWIVSSAAACGQTGGNAANDAPVTGSLFLTVENVGGHCSVAIADDEPFTSPEESVGDLFPETQVPLTASAVAGFTLGLWHHTINDTGSGDPGVIAGAESSTSVALGESPGCVWICCSSQPGDCPTTDQCP